MFLGMFQQKFLPIFFLWLTHVSAVVGIACGYASWFLAKTPANLLLAFSLMVLLYPLKSRQAWSGFILCFLIGFAAEWVGVNTGWLFGDYRYGENLGIKIGGVPLLIGVNWAVLALSTSSIAHSVEKWSPGIRCALAATLMVALDVLMEPLAPRFDFWYFANNEVPLWNYVCWWMTGFIMQWLLYAKSVKGDVVFSTHVFLVNIFFFGAVWLIA